MNLENPNQKHLSPLPPEHENSPQAPWADVEAFLRNEANRQALRDHIRRELIGFSPENAVLSFRTLEAAVELGIIPREEKKAFLSTKIPSEVSSETEEYLAAESEPDTTPESDKEGEARTLREKLSDDMKSLDGMISETLRNKDSTDHLRALGWHFDRIAFDPKTNFEPDMTDRTLEGLNRLLQDTETKVREITENKEVFTKEQAPAALHILATFVRTKLIEQIPIRKELLPDIRDLAVRAIPDKLQELKSELALDPPDDSDLKKDLPRALYGLFLLADILTIRKYAESKRAGHTS